MRNKINYEVKRTKSSYYSKKLHDNSRNSKDTWSILNDPLGKKSGLTQINEVKVSLTECQTDSKQIADHFNKHYTQVGPNLASALPTSSVQPEHYFKRSDTKFVLHKIKYSKVLKLLLKANAAKVPELDHISNKVLKLAGPVIYLHLTDLFNLSIKSNVFPTDWKVARVSPIFKMAGERNDPNNYRPISVLSTVARIFERLIYEQLFSYLNRHNLLNQRQSGFRSLHSTVTALLDLTSLSLYNLVSFSFLSFSYIYFSFMGRMGGGRNGGLITAGLICWGA